MTTKEVLVAKAMVNAISASVSNLGSIIDKDLPNEHEILKQKIFELRDMVFELINVSKLRHPEMYGKPVLDLPTILEERKKVVELIEASKNYSTEQLVKEANNLNKLRKRLLSLDRAEKKLSEIDKLEE